MKNNRQSDLRQSKAVKGGISMDKIWAEAAASFESICGESLRRGEVKSFEDVQRRIEKTCERASSSGSKPEDKWDTAKTVGLKSLQYLKLLVGAAAQASSLIPIPPVAASITTTALSFVFDIPQTIKGYNNAIDGVFSEVSSALSQFQIYRSVENLDPLLVEQIHLVLVSFVKICAHVVKYRQSRKRDRFWEQTKFVFGENSALNDEMTEFKGLLHSQRDVEGTVTLAVVAETRKDMAVALEKIVVFGKIAEETHQTVQETQKGVQSLNDDSDRTKTLTKIRDILGVPLTVHLDTTTTQTCVDLANKCLQNTGSWIWKHDSYLSWTAGQDKDVLIVSGPPSSGKTSACALITKRLEEQKDRTYVAHYFFPPSARKSDDNKNSVQSALKYMAFQIARVDATVLKTLGKACDTKPAVFRSSTSSDLNNLWKELNIGAAGSGATYYFVFDGVENLPDAQAGMLLDFASDFQVEQESAGRVRLLISGTKGLFDKNANVSGALRIDVEKHNQDDMRIFIQDMLNKNGLLQSTKPNSEQERAKAKILEKIPPKVDGKYSLLRFELDRLTRQLSKRTAIQELDEMLDQTMSSLEAAIKDLERSLTADEISELNELLKWVMYSHDYMSLAQLEAAMVLTSDIASLTSLEYVIRTKYSAILSIEDEYYVYLQDGVEEYLQKADTSSGQSQRSTGGSTISMTISINNVDQELCGNFLWDLADMAIRNKFKFNFDGEAFKPAHSNKRPIAVDELEANYTIVTQAFKYLSNEPTDGTQNVGRYVVEFLPYHLNRIRELEDEDKGMLRDDQRSEIGQGLYKIFRDDTVFQRHIKIWQDIEWSVDEMRAIQTWLMDSAAVRKVDRKWRTAVQKAPSPVRGYLNELVKMVLRGLLRQRSWQMHNASKWLKRFMELDQIRPAPSPTSPDDSNEERYEVDSYIASLESKIDWEAANKWCQDVLGLPDTDLDSLWYEGLAKAASAKNDNEAAISLYKRAIECDNPSWLCYRELGVVYDCLDLKADAIEQLEIALDRAAKDNAHPEGNNVEIVTMHLILAEIAAKIDNARQAADHYSVACESEETSQVIWGHIGLLRAALSLADPVEVIQVLEKIFSQTDQELTLEFLRSIMLEDGYDSLIWSVFHSAKDNSGLLKKIMKSMESATAILYRRDTNKIPSIQYVDDEIRGMLLYYQGVGAYNFGVSANGTTPTEEAIRLWTESRDFLKRCGGPSALRARSKATSALSNHYFDKLMDEGLQHDHMKALTKMVKDDSEYTNIDMESIGLLGALYARNNDKERAREVLRHRVKEALQILSDDIPENDYVGFDILFQNFLHCQDLEDASIALSLLIPPDTVTVALQFSPEDLKEISPEDRQRVMEAVNTLAQDIIQATRAKVPDLFKQYQRLDAAQAYFEDHIAAAGSKNNDKYNSNVETENAADGETKPTPNGDVATLHAHSLLRSRLFDPEIEIYMTNVRWGANCDGSGPDGKKCTNLVNRDQDFFHCTHCSNRVFCGECLARLRDPDSDSMVVCSPKHQWLRIPPQGDSLYFGDLAKRVRKPSVKAMEGDDKVFIITPSVDEEWISVQAWQEGLVKEWKISQEELKGDGGLRPTPPPLLEGDE
ncbi:NACHT and TPR domain-containing protein [Colletotrichum gloeosporioides Cg-14]|uniref:NACHT and TPR domain-containing protein n=1 Tax=Colletotrichum gloeosporioides (strain Cg-14) TaxID=1237896 RepID=T0K9P1_COLGC|nr:NACHT and TPR domain-containing protein [Colletotrichum gloeosporioides Cg-14]